MMVQYVAGLGGPFRDDEAAFYRARQLAEGIRQSSLRDAASQDDATVADHCFAKSQIDAGLTNNVPAVAGSAQMRELRLNLGSTAREFNSEVAVAQAVHVGAYAAAAVIFVAAMAADVATVAADIAAAAANGIISGDPTALQLVGAVNTAFGVLNTAGPLASDAQVAAVSTAIAAAAANPTISGNGTALGLVNQIGTDFNTTFTTDIGAALVTARAAQKAADIVLYTAVIASGNAYEQDVASWVSLLAAAS